jgi:multiple sugar transport system substrate-binding protein
MFEVMGYNPGRSDIYKDEELLKKYPRLEVLYDVLNSAVLRPTIPYYPQISDIIQRYVNDCLAGKISPADALKGMQSEINDISKLYER